MKKLLRWFIIALIFTALSPIVLIWVIYELTPNRREFKFRYEMAVLGMLAHKGETKGRTLRKSATKELSKDIGSRGFWSMMARLEDAGTVERRIEPGTKQIGDIAIEYNSHYFRLTAGGRRMRNKKLSAVETLRWLPGRLAPSPA